MKAAPDRCLISLRADECGLLVNAIECVRERAPFESDREREAWEREAGALEERIKNALAACDMRGSAARIEADLT